ncbi:hypothetical protein BDEG_23966 [Batrachochytrium dendrobatidis JEL423]|uniref:Uncharacterized protein n=1 Tax=Batrachochytrium dendrobatidis (strain JEL423) TaxID=403673 RepID=A0A177WK55_BATDL|nr:hypothetical protein BDEG_23966 [Batrachochytrium dendrobatidis JEL423]
MPTDFALIFELSKTVITGERFDLVLHTAKDLHRPEGRQWHGRVWGDLTSLHTSRVLSCTQAPLVVGQMNIGGSVGGPGGIASCQQPIYQGSIEQMLQVIFSRFDAGEFSEGVFLVKADYGQEWFSPVLQHPHCVLRHLVPTHSASSEVSREQLHHFSGLGVSSTSNSGIGQIPKSSLIDSTASITTLSPSIGGMAVGCWAPLDTTDSVSDSLHPSPNMSLNPTPIMRSESMHPSPATVSVADTISRANPITTSTTSPQMLNAVESHVLFYLGPNVKNFCYAFYAIGLIPGVNCWSAVMLTDDMSMGCMDSSMSSPHIHDRFPSDQSRATQNSFTMPHGVQAAASMVGQHSMLNMSHQPSHIQQHIWQKQQAQQRAQHQHLLLQRQQHQLKQHQLQQQLRQQNLQHHREMESALFSPMDQSMGQDSQHNLYAPSQGQFQMMMQQEHQPLGQMYTDSLLGGMSSSSTLQSPQIVMPQCTP